MIEVNVLIDDNMLSTRVIPSMRCGVSCIQLFNRHIDGELLAIQYVVLEIVCRDISMSCEWHSIMSRVGTTQEEDRKPHFDTMFFATLLLPLNADVPPNLRSCPW